MKTSNIPEPFPKNGHPLSSLYHDLRTPLNQILGYSELLREQATDGGQTQLASDLERIEAAGRQLLSLVNAHAEGGGEPEPPRSFPSTEGVSFQGAEIPVGESSPEALILVVDDNKMNRDMLVRRLEQEGYRAATAADGRSALEWARTHEFDLMLLDIMMPELDGYGVLREMKADPALKNVPVIMVSALDEIDGIARCIEMGAEDYLPKPFNKTLLKARVHSCLEKKRAHDREARLFDQLQANYEDLKRLERLRDDLTHMIIHDLRTPLSSVISGMQTLEGMGELSPDQREIMEIALSGGDSLLTMINGLLDIDKMESGSMPLTYTLLDARALIAGAVVQIAPLAEDRQLAVSQAVEDDLPPFTGDEEILRRVLVNLLGNAIKFSPLQGEIWIEARRDQVQNSVRFAVRDSGEGIPAEAFEQIFEKFGQVETRLAGRKMSTGLGLTFCKLAVEAHGGMISVESALGSGSTFFFSIPVTQVASHPRQAA